MPRLTLELGVRDVHGEWIVDPTVQVRLGPPDGVGTVTTTVALSGAPCAIEHRGWTRRPGPVSAGHAQPVPRWRGGVLGGW